MYHKIIKIFRRKSFKKNKYDVKVKVPLEQQESIYSMQW